MSVIGQLIGGLTPQTSLDESDSICSKTCQGSLFAVTNNIITQSSLLPDFNWKDAMKALLKLQRKIEVAYKEGDIKKVTLLQRILVNSWAVRMLAVRLVVLSKGAKTPGVDQRLVQSSDDFLEIVKGLGVVPSGYKPKPVKRVMIPKGYGTNELRALGIPTMFDRAVQSLYGLSLLPIAELTADEGSYGFRKGRGQLDAVLAAKRDLLELPRPALILDANIKKFFDTVSHDWLLENIPMDKTVLKAFLTAGSIDKGQFVPSPAGFPQGSIISPMLTNMTLNGLYQCIHDSLAKTTQLRKYIRFIRYADDFCCSGS